MFDMKGKKILLLSARVIPDMFQEFQDKVGLSLADVDYIIPHQASRALPLIMEKLGVPDHKYLNIVSDYGNMVSVAVPFGLARPGTWPCQRRRYHLLNGNCSGYDGQYVGSENLILCLDKK